MPGNHISTIISLLSLAIASLAAAKPILVTDLPHWFGILLLVLAIVALMAALLVGLHGVGSGPRRINRLLDQWLGVAPGNS